MEAPGTTQPFVPEVFITGGQVGADSIPLKVYEGLGVRLDGYMPKGFDRSGGGGEELAKRHGLREADGGHARRDRLNVELADAVLAFLTDKPETGRGTMQTCAFAVSGKYKHVQLDKPQDSDSLVLEPGFPRGKPALVFWDVCDKKVNSCADVLQQFLVRYRPSSLMFSGSLERNLPGVERIGAEIVRRALSSEIPPLDVCAEMPLQHPSQQRRVVLVGIAGASGCGKSTLAKTLVERLGSPVESIYADHYNSCTRKDPKWGPDWEQPEGVNFRLLLSDVQNIVCSLATSHRVPDNLCVSRKRQHLRVRHAELKGVEMVFVVVEGFLLFHDPDVAKMCDFRLWLDCDSKVCATRRYVRKSRGGAGESFEQFCEFYDALVWSNYIKHKDLQLAHAADALRLDARVSAEALADTAEVALRDALKGEVRKESTQAVADATEPERLARRGYASVTDPGQKPARRWKQK